jgi:dGTPase
VIIHLINRLVTDVIESSVVRLEELAPASVDEVRATRDLLVGYSDPIHQAKRELKEFLREHFYHHPSVRREAERAQHVLADLFRAHSRDPSLVPAQYFREEGEMRVIADYLSGMTDRYAMTIHGQLMVGNTSSLPSGAGG